MYDTQEITEVLEYLAKQTENIIEQEIKGTNKFLVTTLKIQELDEGYANVQVLAEAANSKEEMKQIIIDWGYDLETVTPEQVQIYDLEELRK